MEKYYCDHCRTLYENAVICKICGNAAGNKIRIEVQTQQNSDYLTSD